MTKKLKTHWLYMLDMINYQVTPCGLPIRVHYKLSKNRDDVDCDRCKKTKVFRHGSLFQPESKTCKK